MMSLLTSYYGIESSPTTTTKSEPKDQIDAAGFDHTQYVKNLLSSTEIHELMKIDSKMVQDVKALDANMQTLVYENYNKFISATETIKRMKSNVEAMDSDMESVRSKMALITTNTSTIDASLADKRSKVDKLVRVKRLLNRLEFLSELPERLERMIEKEMYTSAIQLYKKTINVLTKQSHVLSFKKIQEKTENMMKELRVKVMGLFDSNNLEVQQLTQYVGILRLMEAPRERVIEKFLNAHKTRSMAMIRTYSSELDKTNNSCMSVAATRTFHQSLIVALIEASKGVREIFESSSATTGAFDTSSETCSEEEMRSQAYDELQAMIGIVIPEYSRCISGVLKAYFCQYELESSKIDASCAKRDETEDDTSKSRAMEEEKSMWIALTRQIILDCQYLDAAAEACRPASCDAVLPHADGVAECLLHILDSNLDVTFDRFTRRFLREVQRSVPEIVALNHIKREAPVTDAVDSSFESRNAMLLGRMARAKTILESLSATFLSVFDEVCSASRSLIDTHSVVARAGSGIDTGGNELMWRYCDAVARLVECEGGLSRVCNAVISHANHEEGDDVSGFSIYEEDLSADDEAYCSPSNEQQSCVCFISSILFSRLHPTLLSRLDAALKRNDISASTSNLASQLRDKCSSRLEISSLRLLDAFIKFHSRDMMCAAASLFSAADAIDNRAVSELVLPRDLTLSSEMIEYTRRIDAFSLLCAILLNEAPPPPQIRASIGDRDASSGGRRSSLTHRGPAASANSSSFYHHGLHLDIERMFSRKIRIFDLDALDHTVESISGVLIKSSLKACEQLLRCRHIGALAFVQLHVDFAFFKQVVGCYLKDTADADSLIDEILTTISSRCCVEAPQHEVQYLSKVVYDGLQEASKKCYLLNR